jgi:hypothetical protein
MTGWNMPPGCNVRDIPGCGDEYPCDCCGNDPADCICPECPVCTEQGNKACYKNGHINKFTNEQLMGQTLMRIMSLNSQLGDEMAYLAYLQTQEGDKWKLS